MSKDKNTNDDLKDEDILAIYSLVDPNIAELGKVLSAKYSREFYAITLKDEFNLKEIAKQISDTENPRLPTATHHKDRLLRIGLIICEKKLQRKKGHYLNYYKGKPFILIVPKEYEINAKNLGELKKIFKEIMEF